MHEVEHSTAMASAVHQPGSTGRRAAASAVVFAPAPLLTVTIEQAGGDAEVHLHGGGQGFWLARMIAALGTPVRLCATFGGETGAVVRMLIEREGVATRWVARDAATPAYVHDRRSGDRIPLVETVATQLTRHEADDLYALTLVEALDASVCILGGDIPAEVVPADVFRRLAADVTSGGTPVVADLAGKPLDAALAGGVDLLKVSHEQLLRDGRVEDDSADSIVAAMRRLQDAGARMVVVSRGESPALACDGRGVAVAVAPPRFEALDARGAGDSMTAALAVGLVRGLDWHDTLRLGAAAGALNATRHGLGTGSRNEIESLARRVEVRSRHGAGDERGDEAVSSDGEGAVMTPEGLAARAGQP